MPVLPRPLSVCSLAAVTLFVYTFVVVSCSIPGSLGVAGAGCSPWHTPPPRARQFPFLPALVYRRYAADSPAFVSL